MFSGTILVILSFSFKLIKSKTWVFQLNQPKQQYTKVILYSSLITPLFISSMELPSPFWLTVQATGILLY